jgi:4-alpha-glucanotransferase
VSEGARERLREARAALDVRRLAFSIHDASFPAGDLDPGRGSPYAESAISLMGFAAELGFDVLQLGPQGELSQDNPSPYDGAAFSRSTLSISAAALCDESYGALLRPAELRNVLATRPAGADLRADHAFAWRAERALLARAFHRLQDSRDAAGKDLRERLARFARANREWLGRDALYDALRSLHEGRGFRDWPEPDAHLLLRGAGARRAQLESSHAEALALHGFAQLLAHEQHARFRARMHELGIQVHGDLQIGLADRDVWAFQALFLPHHALGAPPSRTNPEGQAWGYPVFDPDLYRDPDDPTAPGPVTRLVRARMDRMFEAYDGVRIDHPHGLVCPWVYQSDAGRAGHPVAHGARLFSAFGVEGHEALVRHDIPRPEQIDRAVRPWDDHRVRDLEPDQVARYALLFDEVTRAARRAGADPDALTCEVLSTLPAPLGAVLARFGLGRLRVTGKIDPADPGDPYRIEAAAPPDWAMIGSHDTPSVWQMVAGWSEARRDARAAYSARLLEPDPQRRPGFARLLAGDSGLLAQALLAEIFSSRARNAVIFFTDLLGIAESYNRPGTVSSENWSLRVPPDFRALYRERLAQHRALNLPLALALALRARSDAPPGLAAALLEDAARKAPLPEAFRRGVA